MGMLALATTEPSLSFRALRVKIFADGADKASILELARNPLIQGFTTNPTLMRKAGVKDYECFCRDCSRLFRTGPSPLRCSPDEFDEMERQASAHRESGARTFM